MKLKTILASILVLALFTVPVFAQTVTSPKKDGTVTPPPSECADGVDNDNDGTVDKDGRTVGTKVYLADKNCLPSGAICENGTTTCFNQTVAPSSAASDFNLQVKIKNPLKVSSISEAIRLFMSAVLRIALPFIVVFFIWSGISFVLARGNPEKIKTAKNMFWYTIIGTLLILGAWTITNAIIGTVNSVTS